MTSNIPFPKVVDSSILKAFKTCEKMFWYKYMRHLTPHAKSVHLIAGGAYAHGLEVTRKAFYTPSHEAYHDLDHALSLGIKGVLTEYGDYTPPDISPKTADRCVRALVEYFEIYQPLTDHIQPYYKRDAAGAESPAVELTFAVPTGLNNPETGEEILYVGRYDMLGIHSVAKNGLFVVDEKTAGQLGPSWNRQWDLRSQFTGYCWAAQQWGYPTVGAVVRGTSFLSKERFGQAEVITYRPAHMINTWERVMRATITRMVQCWESDIWNLDLDDACAQYGGCDFSVVCTKKDPERWIDTEFEIFVWDPLNVKGVS